MPDRTKVYRIMRRLPHEAIGRLMAKAVRRLPPPSPGGTTAAVDGMGLSSGAMVAVGALTFVLILSIGCASERDTAQIDSDATAPTADEHRQQPAVTSTSQPSDAGNSDFTPRIIPFENVAPEALQDGFEVWNGRPGVAVFDYDRDGDLDFYITARGGKRNWLYRNQGDGTFADVAREAGVTAADSYSTGVVACDIDNDGYQDLYVGARGDPIDALGFRSPSEGQGNRDQLFLNNGDGTFQDITDSAFGAAVNIRSASSIACADVDGDGWVDIYVGNLAAQDFRTHRTPNYPGHVNMLYRNNGDLTFDEIGAQAGVRGPQILMRDRSGQPVLFEDPETGEEYEGWDPGESDRQGNQVGEPTGQTHAILFFDYDDDGDPDLWLANDGDRLHIYRNDSSPGSIRFTPVAGALDLDRVGSWMGFAVGDYDADADLDVFVTNIGYHPRLHAAWTSPGGSCEYHDQFEWGTCLHFLLRNDGVEDVPGVGVTGLFRDVAQTTDVAPSPWLPPDSLDPSNIHPSREMPTGLGAYDFGFGATFFDYDNDGVQDLYWLGSLTRGEGPLGSKYASAGRMLRGDGRGSFEDVTVRAHLLDIVDVDYASLGIGVDRREARLDTGFHENGKGLAHGDLNGDGYVDLIATNSSGAVFVEEAMHLPEPGPVFVWMNGGGKNHWLTLRLRGGMAIDGSGSNADGIGARVYVTTTSPGQVEPIVQVQEVRSGSSYLSMDSIDLEFGLGAASVVDEVTINWPSGRTQILQNLSVDRIVIVTEPES